MAKRKTPKAEKIVDLKPKAEKVTDEQLKQIQELVSNINRAQMDIGSIETKKHQILHSISNLQDALMALQGEFEKQYGTVDVDIHTGTINYKEDVETDKKD
tara:strand:- start:59 stop:361 length:303 start_codon:yes stop_codon:yes gene_type:complete